MDENVVSVITDLGLFFKYGGKKYVDILRGHVPEEELNMALKAPDVYRFLAVIPLRYYIGTREDKLAEAHEAEVEEVLSYDLKRVVVLKKKDK